MWGLAATVGVMGGGVFATYHRNSPIFGTVITRLSRDDRARRAVALTFDDGPNPDATPAILDALAAADVRATFFILGRHADRWPHLVRRIVDEGHTVGNHGYFHRKLHVRGPRYVRRDLSLGTRAIEAAGGARPSFFRAPHGFRNPWVSSAARSLGQHTVGWSLGVWDTALPGADTIVERTMSGVRPGSIVLLHDGDGYDPVGDRMQTARAVPGIITALRARDYRLVPLSG